MDEEFGINFKKISKPEIVGKLVNLGKSKEDIEDLPRLELVEKLKEALKS